MKKERIFWIDVYKGFLIILVVIGHVIASYKGAGTNNNLYKIISSVIYSFHMASFIFISGYLCNVKNNVAKNKQIKNKLIAYGIPYILFSLIWVVFKLVFSKYVNTTISIEDFFLIIIYPISFMWYIYATMLMNIVQILLDKIKKILLIVIGGGTLFAVPIIMNYYSNFSDLIICDFMLFWFYFLIGHYYGEKIIEISSRKIIYIFSVIIFIIFNILFFKSSSIISSYYKIITSLSGIIITVGIFKNINKNIILKYIGEKSLSIYVLQGIIIAMTRICISKIKLLNDVYGIIPLIICTIIGCLLPLLIELLSRRIWKLDFVFYPNKYLK